MLCACGFKYTPLWIQGLKRLVLWTQNLTLLEDQGLWTQTPVLHLSYAKAASLCQLSRLVLWTQYLTLLEDQGLWIQAPVLHCSCTKAASSGIRARFTFSKNVERKGFVYSSSFIFLYFSEQHNAAVALFPLALKHDHHFL